MGMMNAEKIKKIIIKELVDFRKLLRFFQTNSTIKFQSYIHFQ